MIKAKGIRKVIKEKGAKHAWLMAELGISKGTFYSRLRNEYFRGPEYLKLKELKIID
jgi:hypothetical protein